MKNVPRKSRKATSKGSTKLELEDLLARYELELPQHGENWAPKISSESAVPTSNSGEEALLSPYRFEDLPICRRTIEGLSRLKVDFMTKIQQAAIPHILAGRDIIGEAPTGSGKTLAYVVPTLDILWKERWTREDGVGCLILTPTRELSQQIFDVVAQFKRHDLGAMVCYGGKRIVKEQQLISRSSILVGTPGRLREHLETTVCLNVDNLKVVVLDEADKLIEMGFLNDVRAILAALPPKEQRVNLMFSATLNATLKTLARDFCRQEGNLEVLAIQKPKLGPDADATQSMPSRLVQTYCTVNLAEKLDVLYAFLCKNFRSKILVFVSSIKQCRLIYESFQIFKTGARICELHAGQDMSKRLHTFDEFNSRRSAITLVATDLLGRGIDFPNVDWVVQLDAPPDVDTYVHRVGRTARGATSSTGHSVLFLLPSEMAFVDRLKEKRIEIKQVRIKTSLKPQTIARRLAAMCARSSDLRHLAVRAFQTYYKSISIMADKGVFRLKEVLKQKDHFAASLGLPETPDLNISGSESYRTAEPPTGGRRLNGGVVMDESAKSLKNASQLERLKAKIASRNPNDAPAADDDLEDQKLNMSRREKQRQKILAMRSRKRKQMENDPDNADNAVETLILEESALAKKSALAKESALAKSVNHKQSDEPLLELCNDAAPDLGTSLPASQGDKLSKKNWREYDSVQKAIKKQRIVIRADGTAKLKGAAKLVPVQHKFFDEDEQAHDVASFQGIMSALQAQDDNNSDAESLTDEDEDIKNAKTQREKFILKVQKRVEKEKQARKTKRRPST